MKVKLDEVIEAICFSGMESEFYYDCRAEKVIMYFDGMIDGEVNKKLEEELFYDFGRFISLPSQYDIHKYSIMENFIFVLSDNRIQNYQLNAIRGRGAFRRFKDAIIYFEIENDWYNYLDSEYERIAREWCNTNNIEIIEE